MTSIEVASVPAPPPQRQVFRKEAMRAYAESSNRPVLARFTTPFAAACCWLLVVLLCAGGVLAWTIQVPMTVSGMALVAGGHEDDERMATILVVLSPDHTTDVQAGDEVTLRFGTHADIRPLVSLDDGPSDPRQIRERFGLDVETASVIPEGSRVVIIHVTALPPHVDPEAIGEAEIQVGTQRVAAALPVIGGFFS